MIKSFYETRHHFTIQQTEHAWNTFRLGVTALKADHQVEIFLMNEGSELDTIPDSEHFDISAKVAGFKELKGKIACSTCLKNTR